MNTPMTTKTNTNTDGIAAMCAWLRQAYAAVNAHCPNIDWALGKTLPNSIRIPPTVPLPPFLPQASEELIAAGNHLDWALEQHFVLGNIPLKDVTEAWRSYYKLHLPVSPNGGDS